MFPFNEAPISKLRTSSDIEKFGHQSLIRALNIGRVVAFVGSGTSLKFGQPSWGSLSNKAAQLFFDLEHRIEASANWREYKVNANRTFREEFMETLTPLVREIKDLRQCGGFEASHFIELVEDYFAIAGELLERHRILQDDEDCKPQDTNGDETDSIAVQVVARTKAREAAFNDHKAGPLPKGDEPRKEGDARQRPERFKDDAEWEEYYAGPVPSESDGLTRLVRNVDEFRAEFARVFESLDPAGPAKLKVSSFAAAFKGLGLDAASINEIEDLRQDISKIDAARTLRSRLGIRRYLTLNYDLELEMMLFEEGRASPLDSHKVFEAFVLQQGKSTPAGEEQERGRAVTLKSPSGRVIRSSSSRKETLADLFSFGAFPTNYDATVHHLHGRVDDPKNMIVTPKDYQRIYYGASEQKKSFDEARHAVFTGSDLLVLGMGTSEQDVLKPLRDFLELEADRRDAHGKVYYLTRTTFSGEHGCFKDAFFAARRDSMAQTQNLYKDYGMHTLFIDQCFDQGRTRVWSSEVANLMAARAEIANYLKKVADEAKITPWTDEEIKNGFEVVFNGVRSYATPPPEAQNTGHTIEWKACGAVALARELAEQWNQKHALWVTKKKADSEAKIKDASKIEGALKALDGHLSDRGLVQYAESLQRARKDWWENWSEFPGLRVAMLGPHRYQVKGTPDDWEDPDFEVTPFPIKAPMIWRQTNLHAQFRDVPINLGSLKETPQFTGLIVETARARVAAQSLAKRRKPPLPPRLARPASVARISIPPGGGKGRLLSFFAGKQTLEKIQNGADEVLPFQLLFNGDLEHATPELVKKAIPGKDGNAPYVACFTAHLTHALEFSSCMIAFARLLQQLLPDLLIEARKHGQQNEQRWEDLITHQFQTRSSTAPCIKVLRSMYALLKEACPPGGWKTRMVVMLSYLDRLVDDKGDAYSPIHRAFFRLISGWDDGEAHLSVPIDVVLINCQSSKPIRYLSHEERLSPNDDDRRDEDWQSTRWARRHNRKVALAHWTELPRVRPRVIFMEALEHAGAVLGKADDPGERCTHAEAIFRVLNGRPQPKHDHDFLPLPPNLKQFMYRRVVNGHMVAGLANAIWLAVEKDEAAFQVEWSRSISALDMAHAREKTRGLIDELLGLYRRFDRMAAEGAAGTPHISRMGVWKEVVNQERFRTMMVDHLALLNFPVTAKTLAACPDLKRVMRHNDTMEIKVEDLVAELDTLVARGLAARYFKYCDRAKGQPASQHGATPLATDYVYALDTRVAAALRARANLEVYSQYKLMTFQPNVYPSQPEQALKPDPVHFERVSNVVRALVKTSHDELVHLYWEIEKAPHEWNPDPADFAREMEAYNDKLRTAYALVRGTFSISVIARLAETAEIGNKFRPFDEYRTWTRKLLNTATLLSKIRTSFMKHFKPTDDPIPYNHTFLRDEISWLYNERALVSFVQGRLFDALPLFEQSRVMLGTSTARSDAIEDNATHRRVQMNLALAQVERGNIVFAKDTLSRIIAETSPQWSGDTPSVMHCMATGYLALCHHLTNEFTRAEAGYKTVLDQIGQFDHPRAESIFRRHYADLLRTMHKSREASEYTKAIKNLRSAEELALGLRATDLYHYALMAQARLHRDMRNRSHALENLRHVEKYARNMGIQKMLCEVLKVRAEVLLAEGETTQAGFVAAQSIAISKRNGMRLRKISASIIQAKILTERDQKKDAQRLLHETVTESQVLGYATKTSQAAMLLRPET